jgi:hypothetical protein
LLVRAQTAASQSEVAPRGNPVNKRPLKDWLRKVKAASDRGELNPSVKADLIVECDRDSNGHLSNAVVLEKRGDPKALQYATDFISALSDSGALSILRDAKRVRFSFNLTEAMLRLAVSYQAETQQRAAMLARSYGLLLQSGKLIKKDKPKGIIYANTTASSSEKEFALVMALPRRDMADLFAKLSTD